MEMKCEIPGGIDCPYQLAAKNIPGMQSLSIKNYFDRNK